jgi:hypothetical protein
MLFDHLVGLRKQRRRDRYTECLSCLEIDHQLVLGRRLYRQVCWLLALEDAIDIARRLPELVDVIRTVSGVDCSSHRIDAVHLHY